MEQHVLKDGRELLIREADEADAQSLIDYFSAVNGETDFLTRGKGETRADAEREKAFLRASRETPGCIFLIGLLGEEIVCSANLSSPSRERLAHNCELGITVRKRYWHLGAASALLAELIAFAERDPVLRTMHLGVYENNGRAIRLYEKFGFCEVGRHRDFFRVGDSFYDEILMDRDVSSAG